MDSIEIQGGVALKGKVRIAGAKNACLTLMPSALLTDQPLTLTNAPRLSDITTMTRLLTSLGAEVQLLKKGRVIAISAHNVKDVEAHYDIVRKMRASFLVLGPLLARKGRARVSLPGGCAIGARAVDLHLAGLKRLGAEIELENGYVEARCNSKGLVGNRIRFPLRSVGATENLIMAATRARGETVIENPAREPEIVDLVHCLRAMGGEISGEGTGRIHIQGNASLGGATHSVIEDRIEVGTFILAAAITGGSIELERGTSRHVGALVKELQAAGVGIESTDTGLGVSSGRERLKPLSVSTAPYPGFPTDLQAQLMAALAIADGRSEITETIFENRFMHVSELRRMGARIELNGRTARIFGVEQLKGAPVMATDLRASVALVLAGLAAKGKSVVSRVYHLDRGYENIERKLRACGARIRRVSA
ncbi:MAG: UDP-N-acetylglucosamine 1-carboxyvinyltransferase [Rhodobacteraceae bacterium]|nr:UDP-N-acetylglucosamine 1-carboxyvinyltransferase [Paracoccaceae bacterium]